MPTAKSSIRLLKLSNVNIEKKTCSSTRIERSRYIKKIYNFRKFGRSAGCTRNFEFVRIVGVISKMDPIIIRDSV